MKEQVMSNRKSILSLAAAIVLGAPLVSLADGTWTRTNDEAGYQVAAPKFGTPYRTAEPRDPKPLALGDVSADRQYVFLGEGNGWQLRPMQNRLENGRLIHVDDPVGHMHRMADTSPVTPQELVARRNSGGS